MATWHWVYIESILLWSTSARSISGGFLLEYRAYATGMWVKGID